MSTLQHSFVRFSLCAAASAALLTSCASSDGRDLPPPREDQLESILTTSTTTTLVGTSEPEVEEDGEGEHDHGDLEATATTTKTNAGAEGAVAGQAVDVDLTSVDETSPIPFTLAVPWGADGPIPTRHTCAGTDASDVPPSVQWSGTPTDAVELAIVMTDVDAGGYVHWIMTGIDPASTGVPEGSPPAGVTLLENSAGAPTYLGPCPPAGAPHTYIVEVLALDQQFEPTGTTADETVLALRRITLAAAEQSGTFPAA